MADIPSAKILNDLLTDDESSSLNGYTLHPTTEIFIMETLEEFCSKLDEVSDNEQLKDFVHEYLPEFKGKEYIDKSELIKDVLYSCLSPNIQALLLPWDIVDFMIRERRDNQLFYVTSSVLPVTFTNYDGVISEFNMGFEMIIGFLFMNSCFDRKITVQLHAEKLNDFDLRNFDPHRIAEYDDASHYEIKMENKKTMKFATLEFMQGLYLACDLSDSYPRDYIRSLDYHVPGRVTNLKI